MSGISTRGMANSLSIHTFEGLVDGDALGA